MHKLETLRVSELLKLCLARPPEQAAWEEFGRRYHSAIADSVAKSFQVMASRETDRRLQFSEELVEDLVQAVYVRLFNDGNRLLDRFSGEQEDLIFHYVVIVSIDVVRDYIRDAKGPKRPTLTFSLDELLEAAKSGLK